MDMYHCVWNVFFAQCKLYAQFKYLASVPYTVDLEIFVF